LASYPVCPGSARPADTKAALQEMNGGGAHCRCCQLRACNSHVILFVHVYRIVVGKCRHLITSYSI